MEVAIALKMGAGHERAKVGVANITWPIQDGERDGSPKLRE